MSRFGFSFSWKRALGISAAKGRLSRRIGVPLTRAGRQRRVGKALGCSFALFAILLAGVSAAVVAAAAASIR